MDSFRLPLSPALLDDPAFSPDPRAHPHFSLSDALSYKAVPSKSPPRDHRSFPLSKPLPPITPEILPRRDRAGAVLKSVSINVPRKTRMKAFVRRLTARHNLDRIDELDETDPFGTNHHHGGPYEAIASSLVQPTPPRVSAPPRANILRSPRESDPHSLRPRHYQSAHRVPPPYGETGLSLHLKPGQVLQPDTIYGSCAAGVAAPLGQFPPQPNPVSVPPSRRQSLPNPQTHPYEVPQSSHPLDGLQSRHASLPTHRERHLGDLAPDTPPRPQLHGPTPYVHQREKAVSPPPRYESSLHTSGPSRSPQHTPPPSFSPVLPQTHSVENMVPAVPHNSRNKTMRSFDNSHTVKYKSTQSSSGIQNRPIDLPRTRHLPKRLVMPAPLQPQPPQLHHSFLPAGPPVWQDGHLDDLPLGDAHLQGTPALYSQEPRFLRKRSSNFPTKTPIPDHAPISQDVAVPIMASSSAKTAEETKERTRRRRLSKRKSDI